MPRSTCKKCCRPSAVCVCDSIRFQENAIPILVLRHEDEVKKHLNTVNLLKLGLSNITIWDGVRFDYSSYLEWLHSIPSSSPTLLYPKKLAGDGQHCVLDEHDSGLSDSIDSLIVLDGTWRNTREMLLCNKWLNSLNTLGLNLTRQSAYRIRTSRNKSSLATIEAVGHVLTKLDPTINEQDLLRPFHRMIDMQIERMGKNLFAANYSNADS